MKNFIEFFDVTNTTHLGWYAYIEQFGYWPQIMFDELDTQCVAYPTILDSVAIAGKLARHYYKQVLSGAGNESGKFCCQDRM